MRSDGKKNPAVLVWHGGNGGGDAAAGKGGLEHSALCCRRTIDSRAVVVYGLLSALLAGDKRRYLCAASGGKFGDGVGVKAFGAPLSHAFGVVRFHLRAAGAAGFGVIAVIAVGVFGGDYVGIRRDVLPLLFDGGGGGVVVRVIAVRDCAAGVVGPLLRRVAKVGGVVVVVCHGGFSPCLVFWRGVMRAVILYFIA